MDKNGIYLIINNFGHELRVPLNVLAWISTVLDTFSDSDNQGNLKLRVIKVVKYAPFLDYGLKEAKDIVEYVLEHPEIKSLVQTNW